MNPSTRRKFLQASLGSGALVSLSPMMPGFLFNTCRAAAAKGGDRILVVVQLSGGNDGLNTVVPFDHDEYQKNRSLLRIGPGQVHKINDSIGLHPAMNGMAELLQDGRLSIVQGVGYPNPNRSHFESMDIWHTCTAEPDSPGRQTGWLGRYLDAHTTADPQAVPALYLGEEKQPLALAGQSARAIAVRSVEAFRLEVGSRAAQRSRIEQLAAQPREDANDLLQFVQRSAVGALASSAKVQQALAAETGDSPYPYYPLAQQLRNVARMIDAGIGTRVYYLTLGGFDTHSQQQNAHDNLLRQLSDSIAAFTADLKQRGHDQRVLLMTFSEFGRRVKENASAGTDHGAAAPMFLVNPLLKAGPIGEHPSLTDLDDGDLKHHTDFRSVYATLLRQWLGVDSTAVLGRQYEALDLFA